jgi:hypothetical protein
MNLLIRLIGIYWIWATFTPVIGLIRRIPTSGINALISISNLLDIAMMIGGIGLLLLREWGRWIILIGTVVHLILAVGPALIHLQFSAWVIKTLLFYGILIVILNLPQARSITVK